MVYLEQILVKRPGISAPNSFSFFFFIFVNFVLASLVSYLVYLPSKRSVLFYKVLFLT